jgi:hypothetical protein
MNVPENVLLRLGDESQEDAMRILYEVAKRSGAGFV